MNIIKYVLLFSFITPIAFAAPGAHGPNGEHLDVPSGHAHSDAGPRIDTFTESFELVGQLREGELSIVIDRYDTNEPVLNGQLEIEFEGIKVPAKFHADQGDYAVDDARFLKAITKPGKHLLMFTFTTGEESDLLEGTLEVKSNNDAHGHGYFSWRSVVLVVLALLAIGIASALAIYLRRRKTSRGK